MFQRDSNEEKNTVYRGASSDSRHVVSFLRRIWRMHETLALIEAHGPIVDDKSGNGFGVFSERHIHPKPMPVILTTPQAIGSDEMA
jgi:hypothetical protein